MIHRHVLLLGLAMYVTPFSFSFLPDRLPPRLNTKLIDDACPVHKMQNYGRAHGLTEFISMQNYHCAIYREDEREMVPLLQDLGVGMIPWSPLGRGFLTRPVSEQTKRMEHDP